MRLCFARITGAVCAGLLAAVTSATLAAQGTMTSAFLDESALVFRASDLKSGQLPRRIHLRNMPPLLSSQVALACLGVPLQTVDLVVYLAESKSCMALRYWAPASFAGAHGPQVAGRLVREQASLEQQLESSILVVMQPRVKVAQPAAACSCPLNEPPVASVPSGSPQQALAGVAIASVLFDATDSDSPTLTYEFSHTLDGGLQQAGLPVGLAEACSTGSGTLSCSVTGSAPLANGLYLIRFDVHDGSSSGMALAELTVVGLSLIHI